MPITCKICGKRPQTGHKVSHSNRKSKRLWKPNLQQVHANIAPGVNKRITVCTRCIRSNKVVKAA